LLTWTRCPGLYGLEEATSATAIAKPPPSTPDDPSRTILEGIETLLAEGIHPGEISFFCHGTAFGTNALLERKGFRTGLLVTEGFSWRLRSRRTGAALRRRCPTMILFCRLNRLNPD
jgi:N-methylhydantoinase A/oxoprolinase/acetone carboxylase beta subunit